MTDSSNDLRTIMVTGGAGYIGSVLVEMLIDHGYKVVVLDRLFFGRTLSHLDTNQSLQIIKDDIRWFTPELMNGIHAVVDMAALSNDPTGELYPTKTLDINYQGRARVARHAKEAGVERYVLISSCSVYGFQDGILDETSQVNPLTTYAKANHLAEQEVIPMADQSFSATVLRLSTVYGPSRRMRFDLALNGMALGLFNTGKVRVGRDGTQWRPIVHVRDACRAILRVIEARREEVNGEIFNVGSDDQNIQILPLAQQVAEAIGLPFECEWFGEPDHRSYQVSSEKIHIRLGYSTELTPDEGAREVYAALEQGRLVDEPKTRTVDWYRQLMDWHTTLREIVLNDDVL